MTAARKTAMLVSALAVIPIVFASMASSLWVAVLLVALAAAAHQGWSANIFTLASDMFPRHAVGTVIGFGGMAGAFGGMLIAKLTGYLLETTGSYLPVFLIAGSAYLAALLITHLLAPARLDCVAGELHAAHPDGTATLHGVVTARRASLAASRR